MEINLRKVNNKTDQYHIMGEQIQIDNSNFERGQSLK